jgi:DNA mismatch endonuclease (patch repair protein)
VSDRMTREQRSAVMARVRVKDTAPELALRRALWSAGVRGWRCHPRNVAGRPDFAWIGRRIAVFVDGAFWHGHPEHYWGQSGQFWDEKIARNRARDKRVNRELAEAGWTVLRLWDFEVEHELAACVEKVVAALAQVAGSNTSSE